MSISGIIFRAIIAVIVCFILVALIHAAAAAFASGVFSPAALHFIDLCIFLLGLLYVIFGTTEYPGSPRV